jgi:hypothetical protein
MWETLVARLLGWIPSPVRLKNNVTAKLCTFGHPIMFFLGDPLPRGPLHVEVTMELWVPEHRTTVRDMTAEAAGQKLEPNITPFMFQPMTLEPGAKPEEQWVALGPPEGEQLRAKAGDKVTVTLLLTRGRRRKLKVTIEPE